jgi:HlyD family secretion protein
VVLAPSTADIVVKTGATGAIVPRNEVAVKSRVSGVVHELFVEPGDVVTVGDRIATIRILPDAATLNSAQAAARSAGIAAADARAEHERAEGLLAQGALSERAYEQARTAWQLAEQDHLSAQRNLRIVREGAAGGTDVSTEVRSPIAGMVLSVDVKVGYSVIESNTFNEGTTVAYVADMDDLVFEGFLDESEVGRVAEGLPLTLTVGALQDTQLQGVLEYISPKGVEADGAVQFEIRAAITPPDDVFVRANSSANADIVLARAEEVLSIDERALRFADGAPSVLLADGTQRDVQLGLSDGIRVQVLDGLTLDDQVVVP